VKRGDPHIEPNRNESRFHSHKRGKLVGEGGDPSSCGFSRRENSGRAQVEKEKKKKKKKKKKAETEWRVTANRPREKRIKKEIWGFGGGVGGGGFVRRPGEMKGGQVVPKDKVT